MAVQWQLALASHANMACKVAFQHSAGSAAGVEAHYQPKAHEPCWAVQQG